MPTPPGLREPHPSGFTPGPCEPYPPSISRFSALAGPAEPPAPASPPATPPAAPLPPVRPGEQLLPVKQAAERLGLSIRHTRRLITTGDLASTTVGRRRLVPASAIDRFVTSRLLG